MLLHIYQNRATSRCVSFYSKMRMHVTTKNEEKITHNVIGYIKGFVEPGTNWRNHANSCYT